MVLVVGTIATVFVCASGTVAALADFIEIAVAVDTSIRLVSIAAIILLILLVLLLVFVIVIRSLMFI